MIRLSNLSNLYYISELAFIIDWITFLLTMVKFILRAHICKECSSHRFTTSIQFSIFDYATQHIYIYMNMNLFGGSTAIMAFTLKQVQHDGYLLAWS